MFLTGSVLGVWVSTHRDTNRLNGSRIC